jgi:hypothetical protein
MWASFAGIGEIKFAEAGNHLRDCLQRLKARVNEGALRDA